jgi:hypothetical protein
MLEFFPAMSLDVATEVKLAQKRCSDVATLIWELQGDVLPGWEASVVDTAAAVHVGVTSPKPFWVDVKSLVSS